MFVVVSMIDQSLGQIQLCPTFKEAVYAAIKIVENWQIAYNVEEIRECLHIIQACHFIAPEHEYSVYIGQPE